MEFIIIAESDPWIPVWIAGFAFGSVVIPIICNAFITWVQHRYSNAASEKRTDKVVAKVKNVEEKQDGFTKELVAAGKKEGGLEEKVRASEVKAEVDAGVAKAMAAAPLSAPAQEVVIANQEPVPVIDTPPAKKGRKK